MRRIEVFTIYDLYDRKIGPLKDTKHAKDITHYNKKTYSLRALPGLNKFNRSNSLSSNSEKDKRSLMYSCNDYNDKYLDDLAIDTDEFESSDYSMEYLNSIRICSEHDAYNKRSFVQRIIIHDNS